MNRMNESSGSTLLLSFLAGAAAGALITALTTPKSAPELREDIKGMGRRIRGKASEVAGRAREAWEDTKDGIESATEES